MNDIQTQNENTKKCNFKDFLKKEVSTLVGGIIIGGITAAFILTIILMLVC